ncbi:hypothetical protein PTKIN_Ptkin13bG0259300 [Pterospermum kingtungense]
MPLYFKIFKDLHKYSHIPKHRRLCFHNPIFLNEPFFSRFPSFIITSSSLLARCSSSLQISLSPMEVPVIRLLSGHVLLYTSVFTLVVRLLWIIRWIVGCTLTKLDVSIVSESDATKNPDVPNSNNSVGSIASNHSISSASNLNADATKNPDVPNSNNSVASIASNHSISSASNLNAVDSDTQQKRRGCTTLTDLWKLPPEERMVVTANSKGQPIEKEAQLLSGFVGLVARRCPIHYESWHKVPKKLKQEKLNFNIEESEKGKEVGRVELYIATHTRKDGSQLNREAQEIVDNVQEKLAQQIMSLISDLGGPAKDLELS